MRQIVIAFTAFTLLPVFPVLPALSAQAPSANVQRFISVDDPVVALTHVRVVDGTGAPPAEDQTVVLVGRTDCRGRPCGFGEGPGRRQGDGPERPHRHSRHRRAARPHLLHHQPPLGAEQRHRSPALPRQRRDHHSHDGIALTLRRAQPATADQRPPDRRTSHARCRTVSDRWRGYRQHAQGEHRRTRCAGWWTTGPPRA